MAKLWHSFTEGGVFNWVLLPLFGVGFLATVVLSVVLWKLTRAHAIWLWISPLLVVLTAWLGYAFAVRRVSAAISGSSLNPEFRSRVLAEGTSEALNLLLFGGAYVLLLLGMVAVSMGVRSLCQQRGRFGLGAIFALAAVIGFGAISLIVRPIVTTKLGGYVEHGNVLPPLLSVPCWLAAAIGATCAGAALSSAESDPERNGLAMGDAIAALLAALAAMLTLVGMEHISQWSTVLGAVSGESVDPDQRRRIFVQGAEEARAAFVGDSLLVLPVVTAFAGALIPKLSALGRGLLRAWPMLLLSALVIIALCVLPSVAISGAVGELETSR